MEKGRGGGGQGDKETGRQGKGKPKAEISPSPPLLVGGKEWVGSLTEEEAVREAERCLACGCGVGCGLCQQVCIHFAVDQEYDKYQINEKCDGCGLCPERCPLGAISMVSRAAD